MKTLNVENEALNGKSMNDELRDLVGALVGPAKGLLVNKTEIVAGSGEQGVAPEAVSNANNILPHASAWGDFFAPFNVSAALSLIIKKKRRKYIVTA